MRKNTIDEWKHIHSGETVDTGMGPCTAPEEEGFYTLYELGDDNNLHVGWTWEKEKEDDKKSVRRTGGKRTKHVASDGPVPDGSGKTADR